MQAFQNSFKSYKSFAKNFIAKNFQQSPNLVTLVKTYNTAR